MRFKNSREGIYFSSPVNKHRPAAFVADGIYTINLIIVMQTRARMTHTAIPRIEKGPNETFLPFLTVADALNLIGSQHFQVKSAKEPLCVMADWSLREGLADWSAIYISRGTGYDCR